VTAMKARRLTGICRYATDRPAYAHLHAHCDGPWRRTYRHRVRLAAPVETGCPAATHSAAVGVSPRRTSRSRPCASRIARSRPAGREHDAPCARFTTRDRPCGEPSETGRRSHRVERRGRTRCPGEMQAVPFRVSRPER
jgi:hypothetical protein